MRWLSRACGLGAIGRNAALHRTWASERSSTRVIACPPRHFWKRAWSSQVSAADLEFGQPVHETHPHLLKAGELTPGISDHIHAGTRSVATLRRSDKSDLEGGGQAAQDVVEEEDTAEGAKYGIGFGGTRD